MAARLGDGGILELEPTLWLSADRDVVLDGAGQVEAWRDQSGHAMNATAVASEQRPTPRAGTRELPLVHFDGSDWLALPSLLPLRELSFFAVASAEEEDRLCPSILHFSNLVTPTVQAHDIEFGRHSRETTQGDVDRLHNVMDTADTQPVTSARATRIRRGDPLRL